LLPLQAFYPLRHRDYRYLWIGILFMSAGQWVQQVTVGWLLYDITGSSLLLGVINGLRAIPFLVIGPVAGVAADLMNRRSLMMGTQAVLMITALIIWPVVAAGNVLAWHLFLFTLISGVAWAINQPVRQSLVPNVVPKKDLASAVALGSMGFNIMKVIGPAIGGLLIAWFGAGGNFLVQGVAYAGVLVMLYLMNVPMMPARAGRTSASRDLREALAYVRVTPAVQVLLVSSFVVHIVAMPAYQALMPVFQKDVLGVGPEGLGLLLAAPGIGAIAATFFVPLVATSSRRYVVAMFLGMVMLGGCLVLFSLTKSLATALVVLVGVGFSQMLVLAINLTMLQLIAPDALRGRVMSIYMMDRGLAPAGALFAGAAAQLVGPQITVTIMGSIVILMGLLIGRFGSRLRETV
jgi:predicted MFS family arabinose efflux permease